LARGHIRRTLYWAYLAQSHVFVGMYYGRYGWVAPGEEVSGLEDEYRLSGGLPRLVYIKAPAPKSRLDELLSRIRDEDTVSYKTFGSRDELQQLLREDLAVLLAERFLLPAAGEDTGAVSATTMRKTTPVPAPVSGLLGRNGEIAAVVDLLASGARASSRSQVRAGSARPGWPSRQRAECPLRTRALFRLSPLKRWRITPPCCRR
jgi:hypothetical protein